MVESHKKEDHVDWNYHTIVMLSFMSTFIERLIDR